jgi:hypothetical protein
VVGLFNFEAKFEPIFELTVRVCVGPTGLVASPVALTGSSLVPLAVVGLTEAKLDLEAVSPVVPIVFFKVGAPDPAVEAVAGGFATALMGILGTAVEVVPLAG